MLGQSFVSEMNSKQRMQSRQWVLLSVQMPATTTSRAQISAMGLGPIVATADEFKWCKLSTSASAAGYSRKPAKAQKSVHPGGY